VSTQATTTHPLSDDLIRSKLHQPSAILSVYVLMHKCSLLKVKRASLKFNFCIIAERNTVTATCQVNGKWQHLTKFD